MNAPVRHTTWAAMEDRQKLEKVKPLLEDGLSYAEISERLGAPSRSSVSGVVNRARARGDLPPPKPKEKISIAASRKQGGIMGGKPGKNPRAARAKAKKSVGAESRVVTSSTGHDADESPAPITITKAAAFTPLPGVDPLPLTKVGIGTGRCCWPVYEGDEPYRFCGADCSTVDAYCCYHAALAGSAYHPSKTRKDA